jgi:hypothetical protein
MRLFVDPLYLQQREAFSLKATCEHCVHFDAAARACSLTYPVEPHLEATHQALKDGDVLLFCKTFEMA